MFPFYTPGSRTGLFRALRRAIRLATLSRRTSLPPSDELAELLRNQPTLNRRNFLNYSARAGLLFGTGTLLEQLPLHIFEDVPARKRQARIAIVGAGVAGLNCAYQLKKNGQIAQVYEASTRAGGRMFSAKDIMAPGLVTEIGGEFIDSSHADTLQLIQEFNLPLLDTRDPGEINFTETFFFGGRHYTQQDLVNAFAPLAEKVQADIKKLPDNLHGNVAINTFDNLSIAQYFDQIGLSGWVRQLLEVAYLTEYGLEVEEQSAVSFLSLFNPESIRTTQGETLQLFGESDERYKIRGGNQRLTDALQAQLKDQVLTEHKLVALSGSEEGPYTLTFEKKGGALTEVPCDVVVLTLPFTTLRQVDIRTPLPEWKTNAIQSLGYGTNAKLMLGFRERLWRSTQHAGYLFSDTGIQTGWDNSQLQEGTAGGYTMFFGGKAGVAVGERSPQEQATDYLKSLERVWPGAGNYFNGQAQRMHWPTHPFTLGSYSCYKVGQWSTLAGNEGKPVGNIYFAGEHCSLSSQGYMNGGVETGKMAAQAILRDKKSKKVSLH